jgi:hypothetical protein
MATGYHKLVNHKLIGKWAQSKLVKLNYDNITLMEAIKANYEYQKNGFMKDISVKVQKYVCKDVANLIAEYTNYEVSSIGLIDELEQYVSSNDHNIFSYGSKIFGKIDGYQFKKTFESETVTIYDLMHFKEDIKHGTQYRLKIFHVSNAIHYWILEQQDFQEGSLNGKELVLSEDVYKKEKPLIDSYAEFVDGVYEGIVSINERITDSKYMDTFQILDKGNGISCIIHYEECEDGEISYDYSSVNYHYNYKPVPKLYYYFRKMVDR